jgi:hypothetical protein
MNCAWCDGEKSVTGGGGLRYCSEDCRNSAIQFHIRRMDALADGEELPTKDEFKTMQQRARRWTPETMGERIDDVQEAANG